MYGSIRRYKVSDAKAFSRKVNAEFINIVRKVPGFVSYVAIDEGNGNWASVSLFTTPDGITHWATRSTSTPVGCRIPAVNPISTPPPSAMST